MHMAQQKIPLFTCSACYLRMRKNGSAPGLICMLLSVIKGVSTKPRALQFLFSFTCLNRFQKTRNWISSLFLLILPTVTGMLTGISKFSVWITISSLPQGIGIDGGQLARFCKKEISFMSHSGCNWYTAWQVSAC